MPCQFGGGACIGYGCSEWEISSLEEAEDCPYWKPYTKPNQPRASTGNHQRFANLPRLFETMNKQEDK